MVQRLLIGPPMRPRVLLLVVTIAACERDRPLEFAPADLAAPGVDLAVSAPPDMAARCGAFTGTPCPTGSFCEFEDRACPVPDELRDGRCVPRPDNCPG